MMKELQKTKRQGHRVSQTTAETFRKRTSRQTKKVMDKNRIENDFWIRSASFRAMRCINDATYILEDTTSKTERSKKSKQNCEWFLQVKYLSSSKTI